MYCISIYTNKGVSRNTSISYKNDNQGQPIIVVATILTIKDINNSQNNFDNRG